MLKMKTTNFYFTGLPRALQNYARFQISGSLQKWVYQLSFTLDGFLNSSSAKRNGTLKC